LEPRKIQKVGRSTLSISLPRDWVKLSGVQQGDVVFLDQEIDGSLRVLSPSQFEEETKYTTFCINCDQIQELNLLERLIVGSYMLGVDVIKLVSSTLSQQGFSLAHHDILVIAETVVATCQNRIRRLNTVHVTPRAKELSDRYELEAPLAQLILDEADEVLGGIPQVLLTIKDNTLMADAGIDRSNAPAGHVVLLPSNPTKTAWQIKTDLEVDSEHELGVIIADSRTQPLRMGNIGMALGVAGFKPIADDRGRKDLFGNELRITRRAVADNLASACTAVMGESNESIPAVILRDAPVEFVDYAIDSSLMWISPEECMYMAIFKQWQRNASE